MQLQLSYITQLQYLKQRLRVMAAIEKAEEEVMVYQEFWKFLVVVVCINFLLNFSWCKF